MISQNKKNNIGQRYLQKTTKMLKATESRRYFKTLNILFL